MKWLQVLHVVLSDDEWPVSGLRLWRYVTVLWLKFSLKVWLEICNKLLNWISVIVIDVCSLLLVIDFINITDSNGLKNILWSKPIFSTYWMFCCPLCFYWILSKGCVQNIIGKICVILANSSVDCLNYLINLWFTIFIALIWSDFTYNWLDHVVKNLNRT